MCTPEFCCRPGCAPKYDYASQDRVAEIKALFSYHTATPEMSAKIDRIRETAAALALEIDTLCPPSADRTAAIRLLQDACSTAVRSVVFEGKGYR